MLKYHEYRSCHLAFLIHFVTTSSNPFLSSVVAIMFLPIPFIWHAILYKGLLFLTYSSPKTEDLVPPVLYPACCATFSSSKHSVTLEGFSSMNLLFKVLTQHLKGVQVRTLSRPLQNLHLLSFESFRGGFAVLIWTIVLLQTPVVVDLQLTDWQVDILLQDSLIECLIQVSLMYSKLPWPWRSKASPHHHTTITMLYHRHDDLTVDRCASFPKM